MVWVDLDLGRPIWSRLVKRAIGAVTRNDGCAATKPGYLCAGGGGPGGDCPLCGGDVRAFHAVHHLDRQPDRVQGGKLILRGVACLSWTKCEAPVHSGMKEDHER